MVVPAFDPNARILLSGDGKTGNLLLPTDAEAGAARRNARRRPRVAGGHMLLVRWLTLALLVLFAADQCAGQTAAKSGTTAKPPAVRDVSSVLADAIGRHDVPGMVAAVIEGDRIIATGAA